MKKSSYFAELVPSYLAEIDDLLSDSEGKSVLQKRLDIKRRELPAILPMIAFSPEMVAVVFHNAFTMTSPTHWHRLVGSEPGQANFPSWKNLAGHLTVAPWALPLVELTLASEGGEEFLVTTAGLEYLRLHESTEAPLPIETVNDGDDDDEGGDLRDDGAEWMAEQGFDALDN
jgi:hypothetical protein